jgi:hypothetical protein
MELEKAVALVQQATAVTGPSATVTGMANPTVIVQNWEESERGWGTRPDGFTVHINCEQHRLYVDWFYRKFNNKTLVPDEYTRASGEPMEVEVTHEVFTAVVARSTKEVGEGKDKHLANAVHGKGRWWAAGKLLTLDQLQ